MRQASSPLSLALDALRLDLNGWQLFEGSYAVTVQVPAILTNEHYAGIPIRDLLVPPCRGSVSDLATGFTNLARWKLGISKDVGIPKSIQPFVDGSLARYVIWAGGHREVDLDVDIEAGRALVLGEYTFGLADGMAICESDDYVVEFPTTDLTEGRTFRCRETGFVALYRRAKELENMGAMQALSAIRGSRSHPWRRIAPWVWVPQIKPDENRVSEIVTTSSNPAAELFIYLVPEFCSRTFFEQCIYPLNAWKVNPDQEFRRHLWNKCANLFFT